jgi:hypothetical protein
MSIQVNHPINPAPADEQTWTTEQFNTDFDCTGFAAGMVFVTRKSDGKTGTLEFNGVPRVYHSFR